MEPISDRTLGGLSKCIAESAAVISTCLSENNLSLSVDANGPSGFPVPLSFTQVHAARFKILEATRLLANLAWGPTEAVRFMALSVSQENGLRLKVSSSYANQHVIDVKAGCTNFPPHVVRAPAIDHGHELLETDKPSSLTLSSGCANVANTVDYFDDMKCLLPHANKN